MIQIFFSTNFWIHYIVFKIKVWKSNIYYSSYLCTECIKKKLFCRLLRNLVFCCTLTRRQYCHILNGPLFLYFMIVCMYNWNSLHGLFHLSFLLVNIMNAFWWRLDPSIILSIRDWCENKLFIMSLVTNHWHYKSNIISWSDYDNILE